MDNKSWLCHFKGELHKGIFAIILYASIIESRTKVSSNKHVISTNIAPVQPSQPIGTADAFRFGSVSLIP